MMKTTKTFVGAAALVALALLTGTAAPAAAGGGCPPFLCYVDLAQGAGQPICPNGAVYQVLQFGQLSPDECTDRFSQAVLQVNVPEGCSGVSVWVEYEGEPSGWTLHVGDSVSNDGFGGDSGSLPAGQNAELQILDDTLTVYGAIPAPPNDILVTQALALEDGAFRVNVEDQFVSYGQPYSELMTPDFGRLFFLPDNPPGPDGNRTVYVGLNRVIHPVTGSANREGCGLRRALLTIR